MAQASDTVWLPVLPSMKGFGPALVDGAGKEADKGGKRIGGRFGTALVAGVAAVGAGMAAAGTMIYQTGRVFEDMSNSIQLSTGATGAELDGLVDSAQRVGQQVPVNFDVIGDAMGNLNTFTGATGETLEGLTAKITDASRMLGEDGVANSEAYGRAMAQWQIPAEEGEQNLDSLFAATQEYGLSLNDTIGNLNTYGSVLQNAGYDMNESAGLFGQLESAGISVSRVMPGLNSAFRNWSQEGKNSREEMERTVEQMQNAETETEALNIATEAFGAEGAQRMTTAVRSGALDLDNLTAAMEDSDGAIADASESTMTWQDQWQLFKNNVMVWLEPLATHTMALLADGMELATDAAKSLVDGFNGVDTSEGGLVGFFNDLGEAARGFTDWVTDTGIPALQDLWSWVKDNKDVLGTLAATVGGALAGLIAYRAVVSGVRAVKAAWLAITTAVTTAQRGLNTAMRANPIGVIITLATALVGALTYVFTQTEWGQRVWETVWGAIKSATDAVVTWFTEVAVPWLQSAWDSIVVGVQWLGDMFAAVWDGIVTGWNWLVDTVILVWEDYLRPAFQAVGRVITWLWENIAMPLFGFIGDAWDALVTGIRWYWENVLLVAFNAVGDTISWLWENIARPLFGFIGDAWDALVTLFKWYWENVLLTVFDAVGDTIDWLWESVVRPVFGWIEDAWDGLTTVFSNLWKNTLKPILQAFGDFVTDDLVGSIQRGVDWIGDAWNKVANFFREPINWVINTVWNEGIKAAFDSVSDTLSLGLTMPEIPTIGEFGGSTNVRAPSISAGGALSAVARADGGYTQPGLVKVGERGPEVIDLQTPGRVYTNSQTEGMLSSGGMGDGGGGWLSSAWSWTVDKVGGAIDWVRGRLADAAGMVLDPIFDGIGEYASRFGLMGELGAGLAEWGKNSLLDWVRGKDEDEMAEGRYGGTFEGVPGSMHPVANAPITSGYGPRNIPGGYSNFHHGVDFGSFVGDPVFASHAGVVKQTGWGPGNLGNIVVLNHGGFDTLYAHLQSAIVSAGQNVAGGEQIARSGTTPNVAPHVHYERHVPGVYNPVNPLVYDQGGVVPPGEMLIGNYTGGAEYMLNKQDFNEVRDRLRGSSGGDTHITQNNYTRGQYRDAQDLRMSFRSEMRKRAGV